jgi:putative peptide zinc metalloprotease protein
VSERPVLAPAVELVGEMLGSGFVDRQWLIKRDGRFIQVSELLYRIAEQADGQRTLDEIAGRVMDATDWMVHTEDVRRLVETRLMPLGVLVDPEGPVVRPDERGAHSPLQINLRKRILSSGVLEPITAALSFLYAPPVVIPVLILICIGHGWLYLVHGVQRSMEAVIYSPWLVLVLVPLIIVSGVFHELGHATALRYGGGKPRGMGVGFYLVYPTFYTDTTDAYRLPRAARVRTDLGGFYFHLIFGLGVIALYLFSGQDFLLLLLLLIDLDILFEFLPHVRLDGYWVLADLTGIPDFLSQTGPFIQSLLPTADSGRTKLPPLKPWVKAVFVGYVMLAVPVITLLLFLLVAFAPGRVAAIWDSSQNQAMAFSHARMSHDFLGLALSALQLFILLLLMLGLTYVLYRVGTSCLRTAWKWSSPTPVRRVAGALGTTAAFAMLAWLWAPQLPNTVWAWAAPAGPPGTQSFEVTERSHVQPPVLYAQVPPVGGNHAPIWQNCGHYDAPIPNETAVHSLEHGAVWVTYRPHLSSEEVDSLANIARRQSHVLVSPFPDLPTPVIASAWGRQLRLDSATDPRLEQFIRDFRLSRQAPEAGEPCTGRVGQPT